MNVVLFSYFKGKLENVPNLLTDLLPSTWPEFPSDLFDLFSKILVLEEERYDSTQLLQHPTIQNWSQGNSVL